jgi:hypothetical protein
MKSLHEDMIEFRTQLAKGAIQKAYQGLLQYMMGLKNHFSNTYPDFSVSGSLYYGYMDMTYFAVIPNTLKDREPKIAIVFIYDTFQFEVWCHAKISGFLQNTGKFSAKVAGINIKLLPRANGLILYWSIPW